MRIVKLFLISVVALFLLWTVISLAIPSRVRISRATNIDASPERVLALVNDSGSWRRWHPWLSDSVAAAREVHFTFTEKSDSQTVVFLRHPGVRDLQQAFRIHRTAGGDSLTLQWYSDFHLRWFPWEKFSSLFYDQSYGQMMERGLGRIKELSEGRGN